MDKAREEAVWELNLARVYNRAIDTAAWETRDLGFKTNSHPIFLTEKELLTIRHLLVDDKENWKESNYLSLRNRIDEALDDEDSTGPLVDAILALQKPFRPKEVEALFTRRNELHDKGKILTAEEVEEYKSLREEISKLPTGYNIRDQEARDSIHEAAELLRRKTKNV